MPVPSFNWPRTYVMGEFIGGRYEAPILPIATTIIPSTFATPSVNGQGSVLAFDATVATTYGGRTEFTATRDLSTGQYFGFQLTQAFWPFGIPSGIAQYIDTLANGGMSIVVFDALGNWSEFNLYGSEYTNLDLDSGGWGAFRGAGVTGSNQIAIDRSETPDNSSGVLDWSQVDGFEFFVRIANAAGSGTPEVGIMSLIVFDQPEFIAGEVGSELGFDYISSTIRTPNSNYHMADVYKNTGGNFNGNIGELYEPVYSFSIGDGVTPTYFRSLGDTLTPYPIRGSGNETMARLIADADARILTINQTSTCDVRFDGSILAATDVLAGNQDTIIVTGDSSGSCVFNAVSIYNKTLFDLGHSESINCQFFNCEQVTIYSNTTITDCAVGATSSTSKGIYVDDAAGTYSQSISFRESNLGDDITINPSANGVYDFPNITVAAGYTIKLRNDSAVFDIDVGIPVGIPFSTSTAGGAINVTTPPISINVVQPNLIDLTEVILVNNTQDSEIEAVIVSGGGGYSRSLTLGVEYNSGDELILLAGYQQAGIAKEVFRFSAIASTQDITNIDFQRDWENPNVLGIDGSNIPECSTDYIEIQVEVDDADNSTQKARIAAFIVNAVSTFDGLRNWVSLDGIPVIDYPSAASAIVDTDVATVEVINIKPSSVLEVKDSFEFYWKDGIDRVSAIPNQDSSINWLTPARVLVQAIGSGVTEQDKQDIAALINPNIYDMQGAGFVEADNSLVAISDRQGGGGGGDATEANQILILDNQATIIADVATRSSQASVDLIPDAATNADALLGRNIQGGGDGVRTVTEALRANRNRVDMVNGIVYEEDDTTQSHTYSVIRSPLDAVSEVDPS